MKMKTRYLFSLAALALLTAACSSDEMALTPAEQPAPAKERIPFTAVIGSTATTRELTEADLRAEITIPGDVALKLLLRLRRAVHKYGNGSTAVEQAHASHDAELHDHVGVGGEEPRESLVEDLGILDGGELVVRVHNTDDGAIVGEHRFKPRT